MRKNVARLFLLFTQVILIAAFGCFIASVTGTYWFENAITPTRSIHFGLLKYCSGGLLDECKSRDTLFQFKKDEWPFEPLTHSDFDIIFVTLIVSMAFALIGVFTSLMLCCVDNGRRRWRIICSCVVVMTIIAVICCLVGIAYFEGRLGDEKLNKTYKHGWSSLIAWVGFGLLVVDTVLLVLVTCAKPDDHSKKPHSVQTSYASTDTRESTLNSGNDNKALEFTDVTQDAFYVGKNQSGRIELELGSPRGSTNLVYNSDYRSSATPINDYRSSETPITDYGSSQLVYDPRKRSKDSNMQSRKRSFELAYDSGSSGVVSQRPTPDPKRVTSSSSRHPRASTNPVYQPDNRSQELAYDPRKRSNYSGSGRRKRSFQLACDSSNVSKDSGHDSKMPINGLGRVNGSAYTPKHRTNNEEYYKEKPRRSVSTKDDMIKGKPTSKYETSESSPVCETSESSPVTRQQKRTPRTELDLKRQAYRLGHSSSSEHTPRGKQRNTEHTRNDLSRDDTTPAYHPTRTFSSQYETSESSPATSKYNNNSNRTSRSNRYPNIDSEGYQIR